ncbi:hypothetical protein HDU97_005739 [Phlyctochytrium planicorne]|nr:hypothetical protein HDU97_005739 [Phlyctochytrium planicorne]
MAYDDASASNSTAPTTGAPESATQQWVDLTIRFNLASSLLSSISCAIVLGVMTFSPKARSTGNLARTVLLFALFFFDFVNSTGNSIAGILKLANKLAPGRFCDAEGFLGQWSVQGSDLSTLSLAVITFVIAQASHNLQTLSTRLRQVENAVPFIAGAIFIVPLATATTGYLLVGMAVTGSWCWFNGNPKPLGTYVRHGLTHGPRILIILSIITMYTTLFISFRQRIKEQEDILSSPTFSSNLKSTISAKSSQNSFSSRGMPSPTNASVMTLEEDMANREVRAKADAQRAAIMKLLVYPTAYTLLWIPGLTNRLAEALNKPQDFQNITTFFQFTTQLIGFANSVIFGYARFFGKPNGTI